MGEGRFAVPLCPLAASETRQMPFFHLAARQHLIILRSYPNKSSRSISLQVDPGNCRDILEIGKRYVFTDGDNAKSRYADRILIDFHLSIFRSSTLDENDTYYNKADAVGQLFFAGEVRNADLAEDTAAMLLANIFIDDNTFERIEHHLSQRGEIKQLTIDAAPEGFSYFSTAPDESDKKVLEYGWEPDGSRLIWNIDEATGPNKLQIKSFDITFSNRTANNHVHQHDENVTMALEMTLADELRKIKMAVFIIAAAVVVVLIQMWR
jgi:hypothetical protein